MQLKITDNFDTPVLLKKTLFAFLFYLFFCPSVIICDRT